MAIKLNKLTVQEQSAIDKRARSRTAPAHAVERAQIIRLARRGTRVPAIAKKLKWTEITVRTWPPPISFEGLPWRQKVTPRKSTTAKSE